MAITSRLNAYGAALTTVKSLSADNADAIETMALAFKAMTTEKIKNFVATNNLSKALLEEILVQADLDQEVIESILSYHASTMAKGTDKVASDSLTFSMSNLTTAIRANIAAMAKWLFLTPAGWLTLAIAGATAATAAYLKFGPTVENLTERFEEANDTYQATKNELSQLESQLSSVKTSIEELDELAKNGRLTPDQAAERQDLEKTNQELERQLQVKQKLAEVQAADTEQAAVNLYEGKEYRSITGDYRTGARGEYSHVVEYDGVEYVQDILDRMRELRDEEAALNADWDSGSIASEAYRDRLAGIQDEYKKLDAAIAETAPDLQKTADSIQSTSGENYELKQSIIAVLDAWLLFDATATEALAHLRQSAGTDVKAAADHIVALGYLLEDTDLLSGADRVNAKSDYNDAISNFTEQFSEFIDKAIEAGVVSDDSRASIIKLAEALVQVPDVGSIDVFSPNLTAHISSIKTVEDNINSLSEALAEFRDDGIVSFETFDELKTTFGNFDTFENFINVAGNSASTMAEVKEATNALAEEYLNKTEFLGNMTDATAEATIAELKHLGVTNAEEVVMQRVAAARLEAKLESAGLADVTWESARQFLYEAGAAETDISALQALRAAKLENKVSCTDFLTAESSVIVGLMKEAEAAGIATASLKALYEMRTIEDNPLLKGLTFSERTDKLNSLVAQAKADLKEFSADLTVPALKLTPKESSGKSAAEKAAEQAKNAFSAVYNEWKHRLDMQEITLEQFYAWLDGDEGYKKYFDKSKELIDEYRKYEKEAFDGMKEVREGYIQDIDHEISLLDGEKDKENEIIALYEEKRKQLMALLEAHKEYLRSAGVSEVEILRNDDVQDLVSRLHEIEKSVGDIQQSVHDAISDNINNLIELTEELIRKYCEDLIDSLEDQKDEYAKLIELRKELLQLSEREADYQDSIAEKTERLAEIENQLAALKRDNSREARLEEGALKEEQKELQKELADEQRDHYIESAENALDKEQEAFEKMQDEKIEEIEDFLDSNLRVNQAALNQLDNMNAKLYQKLENYALNYTDTTREELLSMWEDATAAAEKYGSVTNASKMYADSDVDSEAQAIVRQMRDNGSKYGAASAEERKRLADSSLKLGAQLGELLGMPVYRDDNGTWWIGDKELFKVYHTGTAAAGGSPTLKQNEVFAKLEDTEMVLPRGPQAVIEKLFDFDLGAMLDKWIKPLTSTFVPAQQMQFAGAGGPSIVIDAPIHMTGDLTEETLRVLKNHPRVIADAVSKQLRNY